MVTFESLDPRFAVSGRKVSELGLYFTDEFGCPDHHGQSVLTRKRKESRPAADTVNTSVPQLIETITDWTGLRHRIVPRLIDSDSMCRECQRMKLWGEVGGKLTTHHQPADA